MNRQEFGSILLIIRTTGMAFDLQLDPHSAFSIFHCLQMGLVLDIVEKQLIQYSYSTHTVIDQSIDQVAGEFKRFESIGLRRSLSLTSNRLILPLSELRGTAHVHVRNIVQRTRTKLQEGMPERL